MISSNGPLVAYAPIPFDHLLLIVLQLSINRCAIIELQVSLVSKDSPMLDGLDTASIEMEEAKVSLHLL